MKRNLLFYILLCILPHAQAQIDHITQIIEPSLLECKYQWIQKQDTLKNNVVIDKGEGELVKKVRVVK